MLKDNQELDLQWNTLLDGNEIEPGADLDQALLQRTAENLQAYFTALADLYLAQRRALESKPEELQIHEFDRPQFEVSLPPSATVFPRAKHVPLPKDPTRWQKFAQDKGIKKRKRSRMVFD
jgi:hypothetical protein